MPSALGLVLRQARGKEACGDFLELTTHTYSLTVRDQVSISPRPSPGSGRSVQASPNHGSSLPWLAEASLPALPPLAPWPSALCPSVLSSGGDTGHWMLTLSGGGEKANFYLSSLWVDMNFGVQLRPLPDPVSWQRHEGKLLLLAE